MKIVLGIVLVVLLLIGGLIVFVFANSGALIERAVETYGPQYLGTSVEIASVELSLSDGSGEIQGLTIGNPAGFEGPHAFHIDRAAIALDVESIGGDVIVVKSLVLDGARPAVVVKGLKDTNFEALLDNLEASTGGAGGGEPASDAGGSEVKLIVDSFSFTNAAASVSSEILGDATLDLPAIELQGIGRKENGVVAAEAVKQILEPISRAITEAVVREQSGVDQIEDRLDELKEEAKRDPLKLIDRLRDR